MIDWSAITHLTFDCYGTLIDWEHGIVSAFTPVLDRHAVNMAPETLLQLYVAHEARVENLGWKPYRDVLREATRSVASELGIVLSAAELDVLPDSIGSWPPFADTVPALKRLRQQFRLAVLSNVDDALFAQTARRLAISFTDVITAEQVRSYKPGAAHFCEALRRLGVSVTQVLHVAQSLYHDHVPAKRLGFKTAWVRRPSKISGRTLSVPDSIQPDIVVPDLSVLLNFAELSGPPKHVNPTGENAENTKRRV